MLYNEIIDYTEINYSLKVITVVFEVQFSFKVIWVVWSENNSFFLVTSD